MLRYLHKYKEVIREAGETYNPALVANYCFELAKEYNRFYNEAPVLKSENPQTSAFRFALTHFVGKTLREGMALLGIEMPEQM